jgi:hypothetical protein
MANAGQFQRGNKLGGGKKGASGRKSKAEEFGLAKLLNECWTLAERKACIKKLAASAKDGDLEATKLLLSYAYGKPPQSVDITSKGEQIKGYVNLSTEDV